MVTVGQDTDTGKYRRKTIGYFKTYNEAYTALIEYHKDPLSSSDKTIAELYEDWSSEHFAKLSNAQHYKSAWKYCEMLYKYKVSEIRPRHIKELYEKDMPPTMKRLVRTMMSQMFDYAVMMELAEKNYPRMIKSESDGESEVRHHMTFSDDEITLLWKSLDIKYVDIILIGCYSGFRPSELLDIKTENINLGEGYIVGGMKTEAGRDRKVPIHPLIRPLIEKRYDKDSEYLFSNINYQKYHDGFVVAREMLYLDAAHRPHDTRKTFITKCKKYNVDEYAIKMVVGHKITDLTERVYTERDFSWLYSEISKIV